MKKKKFYLSETQKETVIEILKLLSLGTLLVAAFVAPGALQIYKLFPSGKKKIKNLNGKKSWELISKLKNEKYIRLSQQQEKTVLEITQKGKTQLLKYNLDTMIIKKPKKWDGWWRVVIFDIPEKNKIAREVIRNLLKRLEFYKLQKSVFVHPYECQKEIKFIKEIYEIDSCVTYLKAKYIENEERLVHKFNLN